MLIFPNDIWVEIFLLLNPKDVTTFRLVCKLFDNIFKQKIQKTIDDLKYFTLPSYPSNLAEYLEYMALRISYYKFIQTEKDEKKFKRFANKGLPFSKRLIADTKSANQGFSDISEDLLRAFKDGLQIINLSPELGSINFTNQDHDTLLNHFIIIKDHEKAKKLLQFSKVNFNYRNKYGQNAWYLLACSPDMVDQLSEELNKLPEIKKEITRITEALETGTTLNPFSTNRPIEAIAYWLLRKQLSKEQCEVLKIPQLGFFYGTALYHDLEKGQIETVKNFLSSGFDVNIRNIHGKTALVKAIYAIKDLATTKEIVSLLMKKGADVNMKNDNDCWTPLRWAVYHNKPEIVDLLLANGADVDAKAFNGSTSLYESMMDNCSLRFDIFNKLIDHGANVNVQDNRGDTPLHMAVQKENLPMVVKLLLKDADPTIANDYQVTPLMMANSHSNEKIKEVLENHPKSKQFQSSFINKPVLLRG